MASRFPRLLPSKPNSSKSPNRSVRRRATIASMKRARACVLLGGTVALAAVPAAVRAQSSDAAVTVKTFYDWYLALPKHAWFDHFGQVKDLFDPGLYTMLQTALHREAAEHDVILDFDPFAGAQSDALAYAVGTPVASGNEMHVPVTSTLQGQPRWTAHLVVVLRKSASGKYVIYNIDYIKPSFNLRDNLQQNLKS